MGLRLLEFELRNYGAEVCGPVGLNGVSKYPKCSTRRWGLCTGHSQQYGPLLFCSFASKGSVDMDCSVSIAKELRPNAFM